MTDTLMSDEHVDRITAAIRSISHGDVSGPTGLEALAMALGTHEQGSVSQSLNEMGSTIADAINRVADAIFALVDAQRAG